MRFRGRPQYYPLKRQADAQQTLEQQPEAAAQALTQTAAAPRAMEEQTGYLLLQVSTAQGAIPIVGASIVISIGDDLLYNLTTDAEGKSITMSIKAPSAELSQYPSEDARPYSTCDATVYFPGYYTNIYKNVQIFSGITSLQNVFLIPLPESQRNERLTIIYDASPHSLYEEGAE